jgi:hypothetical protein
VRDVLAAASPTWLGIAGAVVPSVLALLAALAGYLNRKQLATPGDKTIGQIATEVSANLQTGNDKTVGEMVTEVHGDAAVNGATYEQHGPPPETKVSGG